MVNKWFGVGINSYPSAPLQGCLSDYATIKSDFSGRFNSVGWDFRYALNATATKRNLIEGFKWLGTGPKDILRAITMSGHGTPQTKDGKLQTVFCPVDFNWSEQNSLFAHEMLEIIGNYPKGRLLIIWDSCYSEFDADDGVRSISPLGGFGIREVMARAYPISDQPDKAEENDKQTVKEDPFARAIESGAIECCYLPACLTKGIHSASGETAADVRMGGKAFGAHTNKISKVWNSAPFTTTLDGIANIQRAELDAEKYSQHCYAQGTQKNMSLSEMFGM